MTRRIRLTLVCLLAALVMQADEAVPDSLLRAFHQYYSEMDVEKAISTLDRLIDIHQKNGDIEGEAKARWNKIATLNNAARYDSLLVTAREQREWFEKHKIWNRYYQCWQRVCSAYHDMGHMQAALREAREMGDDAQQRNDNVGRAMAYKQMGIVYYDIRQMQPAIEAFQRSIDLLRKEGDKDGILNGVYDGMCQALDRAKRYREELTTSVDWQHHLNEVLKSRSIETVGPSFVTCHLAQTAAYLGMRQFDKARQSLATAENYQNIVSSSLSMYYVYEMHTRIALAEDDPQRAIDYAERAQNVGVAVDNRIRELYAEALLKAGRTDESASIYQQLYVAKDSIFTRDMRIQLDELNTLFQIDELEKRQQSTRNLLYGVIAIIIIAVLLLFAYLRWQNAKRLKRKNTILAESNRQLELANKKAEESSKMKTEFIKNISHEIRTPLNILNGFTQVILTPGMELDDDEKADMRQRIEDNTQRITELVNKMLELTESSSETPIERNDHVSALQIALQAIDSANEGSFKQPQIRLDYAANVAQLKIKTNAASVSRALTLLLFNARKFQREDLPADEHRVTLRITADHRQLCYAVEDNGIGIPPIEDERIFDEFVQLDTYYEGTGIGLTVARSLVRRLGGDLKLDTTYTDGARFLLTLPL